MKKNNRTVQEWLPFEKILNNGIIQLKDKTYIKIIKIRNILISKSFLKYLRT